MHSVGQLCFANFRLFSSVGSVGFAAVVATAAATDVAVAVAVAASVRSVGFLLRFGRFCVKQADEC